jgi:3-methyladenine DNA glycosylase AlkD
MTRPAETSGPGLPTTVRAAAIAAEIHSGLQSLAIKDTPNMRAVHRAWSRMLCQEPDQLVLVIAMILHRHCGYHFMPYELIASHHGAYRLLTETRPESLGRGLNSWSAVDTFARMLAGPAWRDRLIPDTLIPKRARSPQRRGRRAALVSTVALNARSERAQRDVRRTLRVCRRLVDDHDGMLEKALSWAHRELIVHDRRTVEAFLEANEACLGSSVKREVRSRMQTGLKTPHPASRRSRSRP